MSANSFFDPCYDIHTKLNLIKSDMKFAKRATHTLYTYITVTLYTAHHVHVVRARNVAHAEQDIST